MPRPRSLPDTAELLRLREAEGLSYAQIAERFGVTKGAVFLRFRNAGATNQPKRYGDVIPWRVKEEHDKTRPLAMLRLWARSLSSESDLDESSRNRLARWVADLRQRDLVVNYDPTTPPNPASRRGGFSYVPRREGIDRFPVSNPAVPREQPAMLQCALCGENQDLRPIPMTLNDQPRVVAICAKHRNMLEAAANAAPPRLDHLVWTS